MYRMPVGVGLVDNSSISCHLLGDIYWTSFLELNFWKRVLGRFVPVVLALAIDFNLCNE